MPPGYTFVKRINKTAMSELWEAQGPGGERVAIEVMPLEDAQETLGGLALARTLTHQNLLGLRAYWPNNGALYVLMEQVDTNLSDRLLPLRNERAGLPTSDLIDHIRQIADVLDYLQQLKLVHSAVLPEHMYFANQKTKLGGLGFLRPLDDPISGSATGKGQAAVGEIQPKTDEPIPKSNQAGLAIAYVCLRSRQSQWNEEAYMAALSESERTVVNKAMNPQPSQRFSSCAAMALELRRVNGDVEEYFHS